MYESGNWNQLEVSDLPTVSRLCVGSSQTPFSFIFHTFWGYSMLSLPKHFPCDLVVPPLLEACMNVLCSELQKCNLSYQGQFKNFKSNNKIYILLNNNSILPKSISVKSRWKFIISLAITYFCNHLVGSSVRQLKIGIVLWLTNCQYLWVPMCKYLQFFICEISRP